MKHRNLLIPALVLLFIVVGGVLWMSGPSETPPAKGSNIILISIDTCRADRLSCYGFARPTTPNIDAIAQEGVLFQNAISPTSVTLPSHSSMMTGTRPPFHGVHDNQIYRLAEANVTLAEVLKDNGYTTGAVVGTFVLDPRFGLAQGFETYDANFASSTSKAQVLNERSGKEINRVAKKWLAEHAEKPFFLFLHYYDPHFPYEPPAPYSDTFWDDAYAGEIAYVDHCIGEIKAELTRLGIYDSTMIVITADHGESLGEHGELTHGWYVYGSTTHVPLVIKPPGHITARVVEDKVALIDLAPTILSRLGIGVPADMQGRDLGSYLTGGKPEQSEQFVYSESLEPTRYGCSSILALQSQRWKYIQSSKPELFDLIADPGEINNVLDLHPETSAAMRNRLKALLEERTRTNLEDSIQTADQDATKRLEELGYVGGERPISYEFETAKKDPKDFLEVYVQIMRANHLIQANPDGAIRMSMPLGGMASIPRATMAERICEQIVSQHPEVAKAHEILGRIDQRAGRLEEAATHYEQLIRIDPTRAAALIDLGSLRKTQGRMDEADSLYRNAIKVLTKVDEDDTSIDIALDRLRPLDRTLRIARRALAELLLKQHKVAEAAEQYREVIRINHKDAKAHTVIALDHSQQGRNTEAVQAIEQALDDKPGYKPALRLLERIQNSR